MGRPDKAERADGKRQEPQAFPDAVPLAVSQPPEDANPVPQRVLPAWSGLGQTEQHVLEPSAVPAALKQAASLLRRDLRNSREPRDQPEPEADVPAPLGAREEAAAEPASEGFGFRPEGIQIDRRRE